MDVDVVIIGKNTERTLKECIESVYASSYSMGKINVFYVDGGSSDSSLSIAEQFSGINIIKRDKEGPQTPGMSRNLGWLAGSAPLIQFLDADTVLDPKWLKKAVAAMANGVGSAQGRRRELYPDKNIYHWITDLEWGGEYSGGGDVMIKREVLQKTGGYLEHLKAGEDPDLLNRISAIGYQNQRLTDLMTLHDINMNSLSDYWRRNVRTGFGYAAVASFSKNNVNKFWLKEFMRIIIRGGGGSFFLVIGTMLTFSYDLFYLVVAMLGLFLLLFPRIFRVKYFMKIKNIPHNHAKDYSWHCSLVVIPQFIGVLKYCMHKLFRKPGTSNALGSLCLIITLFLSSFAQTACTKIHKGTNCLPCEEVPCGKDYIPDDIFITRREQIKETYATESEIEEFSDSVPSEYYMGPGDVFSVIVHGYPTASLANIVVAPDGKAPFPRLGYLDVSGKTPEQINGVVSNEMSKFYESPEVTLMIHNYANNKVFVLGRVTNPGVIHFSGEGTLMEALAMSGGLPIIATEAFLSRCMIIRGKDTVIWVNLKELLNRGNVALNPTLKNNDIVFIPESDDEVVYVMGEVRNPGIVRLKTTLTVMDAIMFSGGPTRDASLERVYIVRHRGDVGYVYEIDIKKFISMGDLRKNYLMEDGDIVYVSTKPIENFNYFISKISPAVRLLNVSVVTAEDIKHFGSNDNNDN